MRLVSIPNRDFIKLQSQSSATLTVKPKVSIPNRDFIKLQLHSLESKHKILKQFQSLIGILLNCNAIQLVEAYVVNVSIPNRDFIKLQ